MQGLFWVLLSVPVTWLPPSGMDDSPLSGAGTLSAPSLLKPDTRVRLWHAARSVQGHCRMNFCPRSPLCRLNNNPAKMSPSLSLEADNVTLCGEGCDQAKGLEMGDRSHGKIYTTETGKHNQSELDVLFSWFSALKIK